MRVASTPRPLCGGAATTVAGERAKEREGGNWRPCGVRPFFVPKSKTKWLLYDLQIGLQIFVSLK